VNRRAPATGALFTTSQQTGGAVGLAILATAGAAGTDRRGGSLVDEHRLSFLIAMGLAALVGIAAARPQPETTAR
jgi:hypothetical protein